MFNEKKDGEQGTNWDKIFQEAIMNAPHEYNSVKATRRKRSEPLPSEHYVDLAGIYVVIGFILAKLEYDKERDRPDIDLNLVSISELIFLPDDDRVEIIFDTSKLALLSQDHLEWITSTIITIARQELEISIDRTPTKPTRLLLHDERSVL